MAETNRLLKSWLARSLKPGLLSTYSECVLFSHGAEDTPLARWPIPNRDVDPGQLADEAWQVAEEHCESSERSGRFICALYSSDDDPQILASKPFRVDYGSLSSDDASPDGQIVHAQKHSEAMAVKYGSAIERAMQQMQDTNRVLIDVVGKFGSVMTAMADRERSLVVREGAAAERIANSSEGEVNLRDVAIANAIEETTKFLTEGGGIERALKRIGSGKSGKKKGGKS